MNETVKPNPNAMMGQMPIHSAPKWLGRYPILDTADEPDLDMRAAIHEHHHRMPRAMAEEAAHADYRRDKTVDAAAHHLAGMMAAHAAGNKESAKKHATMYALNLRALGHKDVVTPPDEVASRAKNSPSKEIAGFRSHKGDLYSLPPPEPGTDDGPKGNERDVKMAKEKK